MPTDRLVRDLSRLLAPASVAIVGATDRPGSYGATAVTNLLRAGYRGRVVGVHPHRRQVQGIGCVPSLNDLDDAVDAVVVATPADTVADIVNTAGTMGCGGAIVFAAEFSETGRHDRQRALVDAATRHRLPVIGPNANGLVAVHQRAPLWGDVVDLGRPGGVALITQSGNIGVIALASNRGLRWHTVISVGNGAVVDAATALDQLATAEGVRSVALYLEDDGAGAVWARALAKCAENDVRVAVLKAGRSRAGAAAGGAHTAAVAGDHRVFRALIEEAGGAWCHDPHELLDTAKLLATPRPARQGGLAVITCSGGDCVIAADEADRLGVRLATLAAATQERLRSLLPDGVVITNPLDHTNALWEDTEAIRALVEVIAGDPSVNQVLYVQDTPISLPESNTVEWKTTRDGLVEADIPGVTKAVASGLPELMPASVADDLADANVTAFAGIPSALRALQAHVAPAEGAGRMHDIAGAARSHAGGDWLAEHEAKQLLATHGVTTPCGGVASSPAEALAAAEQLSGPVVLKISHSTIQHKTEIEGVVLGLTEAEQIATHAQRLLALVDGSVVLVESMAVPGLEMMVSATRGGVVPSLVIGLGGVWTEVLEDVTVIPLPADAHRVRVGLEQLRGFPLLSGGRGKPPLALDALCQLAVSVGDALIADQLTLVELNPVLVTEDSVTALDAVIQL